MTDETLDPEDWEEFRVIGHQMVDDMIEMLRDIRQKPVWRPIPEEIKTTWHQPVPLEGAPVRQVYKQFKETIFPYTKGNIHPGFWAWVQGTGTPIGVLADMMASAMNPNVAIGEHSAMYVDGQVLEWSKKMMGFPDDASGILLSGASMANLTAMIIARNHKCYDSRQSGVKQTEGHMVLVYCSSESHSCIDKAVQTIGLGENALRRIPVQEDYRMDTIALEKQILSDMEAGHQPYCIVANVGTVNTGAIDDLETIWGICKKYNLWFHVDGAFGALAILVPEYQQALKFLSQADSLAFDFHKWMFMPYEVGCLLVRDRTIHKSAFSIEPAYLTTHERGLAAGPESFNHYGIELSRGFKSLKIWMSLQHHGLQKYAAQIEKNIYQARYLASLIQDAEDMELLAPVSLNIVCFRYRKKGMTPEACNRMNKEIVMRLQEEGIASPSSTVISGSYAIRVAITNHRSKKEDIDLMFNEVRRLANTRMGEVDLF